MVERGSKAVRCLGAPVIFFTEGPAPVESDGCVVDVGISTASNRAENLGAKCGPQGCTRGIDVGDYDVSTEKKTKSPSTSRVHTNFNFSSDATMWKASAASAPKRARSLIAQTHSLITGDTVSKYRHLPLTCLQENIRARANSRIMTLFRALISLSIAYCSRRPSLYWTKAVKFSSASSASALKAGIFFRSTARSLSRIDVSESPIF